jgi:shikimate dehydrogenase
VMGALVTMPHKINVVQMLDRVSATVNIAGSCNAVRRATDGAFEGDMFDGEGFVRGLLRKGQAITDKRALIVGSGGVGSAIAASLAARGPAAISLYDVSEAAMLGLAERIRAEHPALTVLTGSSDPANHDIIVNATPLGMVEDDPMPLDVSRLTADMFVGEVVMTKQTTAFLAAAEARGCRTQIGLDMLFEMIPAYLDFFGIPATSPENLRALARLST